ncbi:MAG: hypothetical protein ABII79_03210 [bacterium]
MGLWIKRLVAILIIPAIIAGYVTYNRISDKHQREESSLYALVVAHAWLASARLRDDPDGYAAFRDSLLAVDSLSVDQFHEYLDQYRDRPEKYERFTRLIQRFVDSLSGNDRQSSTVTDFVHPDSAGRNDSL